MIGLFKKHLANISKGDVLNIDTIRTIVTECEVIVHRRPITAILTDSRDIEALTPMHFLAPAADHTSGFWTAFRKDYLSLLHHRAKWRKTKDDLKENDIVVMVEEPMETRENHDTIPIRPSCTKNGGQTIRWKSIRSR